MNRTPDMETWAIILAAGESLRMKRNKLLLPYRNLTIIEVVIGNIRQAQIEHILLVTGAYRDELTEATRYLKVSYCHNDDYREGMLSSVQCGFSHLPPSMEAALIFPGDQPEIPRSVAADLMEEQTRSGKGLLVPVFAGKRGHPLLIHRRYREDIFRLNPEEGLRGLLKRFPGDVQEVKVNTPGILKDVDIPADYDELTKPK